MNETMKVNEDKISTEKKIIDCIIELTEKDLIKWMLVGNAEYIYRYTKDNLISVTGLMNGIKKLHIHDSKTKSIIDIDINAYDMIRIIEENITRQNNIIIEETIGILKSIGRNTTSKYEITNKEINEKETIKKCSIIEDKSDDIVFNDEWNDMDIRVLCAAVYVDDNKEYPNQPGNIKTGYVVCGYRHHNCLFICNSIDKQNKKNKIIQGFLTSDNRFVDRKEALEIAKLSKQVDGTIMSVLLSEDLY